MVINDIEHCHICYSMEYEVYECERCSELYCDSCSAKYDQFSRIDYNCCCSCSGGYSDVDGENIEENLLRIKSVIRSFKIEKIINYT